MGFLLLSLVAACGTGGQNRPYVVGMWPAAGDPVLGPLPYVRIDYNEPVRLLNPFDYSVSVNAGAFSTFATQFPDDPNSVYIWPTGRRGYPEDSEIGLFVSQGLVINGLQHYASNTASLATRSGIENTLPVGELGAVSLVDCVSGTTAETVPAPGAHDPVAVLGTTRGMTRRIWVQFDGDGGVGTSLAWFAPGDGAMTPVPLTSTGELTTPAGAMVVGPRGRLLFAAFRDEGTGAISVHRIDTDTGMETGVLVLESQTPGATAVPRGMAIPPRVELTVIHVATEDAGGGTLARIDAVPFTERDLDTETAGIQGVAVPAGGPCLSTDNRTWVAKDGTSDLTLVPQSGDIADLPGSATGVTTALALSPDEQLVLHGLSGFAGIEMLQSRTLPAEFTNPTAVEVSDDVGGASAGATAVIGFSWLVSSDNFLVVLDTPGGAILTEWTYLGGGSFEQCDLDAGTDGVQALPLAASPIVLGTNHGPFPD